MSIKDHKCFSRSLRIPDIVRNRMNWSYSIWYIIGHKSFACLTLNSWWRQKNIHMYVWFYWPFMARERTDLFFSLKRMANHCTIPIIKGLCIFWRRSERFVIPWYDILCTSSLLWPFWVGGFCFIRFRHMETLNDLPIKKFSSLSKKTQSHWKQENA